MEKEELKSIEHDRYRPRYHFRPETNWMNDPNGPIWFEGEYHLFYQYNPYSDKWGTIHWGHAKSKDLLHFEDCGIALYPDASLGELHCYSGCAFLRDGIPVIFYTSVGEGERGPEEGAEQRYAVSLDHMQTWTKGKSPILDRTVHKAAGLHIAMWRDPFIWKEEDGFYMLLGGTKLSQKAQDMEDIQKGNGCIALYYSSDAVNWSYKSLICESEEFWLLECPNMIPIGDYYLLLYSPLDCVRYQLGFLDKQTGLFQVCQEGIFDYSILKCGFYAPNTFLNAPEERKLVVGWISESDRGEGITSGWAGMLSLPREVWQENGRLFMTPAAECTLLRKYLAASFTTQTVPSGKNFAAFGKSLEVECSFLVTDENAVLDLRFFENRDGTEYTSLLFDAASSKWKLQRDHSTLFSDCGKETIEAPAINASHNHIRVFIDHSSVEVFVNEAFSMTARVYPMQDESEGIRIYEYSGMEIESFSVWELALN